MSKPEWEYAVWNEWMRLRKIYSWTTLLSCSPSSIAAICHSLPLLNCQNRSSIPVDSAFPKFLDNCESQKIFKTYSWTFTVDWRTFNRVSSSPFLLGENKFLKNGCLGGMTIFALREGRLHFGKAFLWGTRNFS